ncbi:MAG: Mur ligase family protein [Thermanaerothrix sp.]|nr:Mur ligase family protein [Thermanaerothrix sp.]
MRVLVTGTRGKSSVVRIMTDLLGLMGGKALGRVTGVVPREITPAGVRRIRRLCPASVEEMRWWVNQLPQDHWAVMENSAVRPDLQGLGARWLKPHLVVLTSAGSDHQEEWGDMDPLEVLMLGVPPNVPLAVPLELAEASRALRERMGRPGDVIKVPDLVGLPLEAFMGFHCLRNLSLAAGALEALGMAVPAGTLLSYEPPLDLWDFRVLEGEGFSLAFAFTANDVESAQRLFTSLGWAPEETAVWYHHRRDRPERLRRFGAWISRAGFRQVVFTGGSRFPFMNPPAPGRWVFLRKAHDGLNMLSSMGKVFGCGNVAGFPLDLALLIGGGGGVGV